MPFFVLISKNLNLRLSFPQYYWNGSAVGLFSICVPDVVLFEGVYLLEP